MKNSLKLPLILAAYTVVACVGLAFVYMATAPLIEAAAANEVKSALAVIYPDASDFADVTGSVESGSPTIKFDRAFVAKKDDTVLGMVIQATGPTYDSSTVLVGVNMDRTIQSAKVTANSDTPGLGSKTSEEPFIGQFAGKSIDDAFVAKKDVVAISGATISSKGMSNILKLAGYQAGEYLAKNYGAAAGTGSAPVVAELAPMAVDAALADLFPGAEYEPLSEGVANTLERSVVFIASWLVKKDGKTIGVAVQAKGQTYKASTVIVGVGLDRRLVGVRVNETSDSPNYGKGMLDPAYYGSFSGKSVDDPFIAKPSSEGGYGDPSGDVDSISGATISTMGLANMVKLAGYEGAAYLADKGGKPAPAGSETFAINAIPEEE